MGLFDKKYCDVCGEKIGFLGNRKLEDGNLCKNCAKKLSPWFNERRHSTVDEIKAQLAYREENKQKVAQFCVTRKIGDNWNILFDDNHRWFTVTRYSSPNADENPDILDYSAITGSHFDIDEDRDEIYRKNSEGNNESYNPPRYEYSFNFDFAVNVNNPYFDEIKFRINSSTVRYEPQPTVQISLFGHSLTDNGVNFDECYDYCKYRDMGQEICRELDRIRGVNSVPNNQTQTFSQPEREPAQPAATGMWQCAGCGTQNMGKFCENCGNPRPVMNASCCSNCGWMPPAGQPVPRFCPECGKQILQ